MSMKVERSTVDQVRQRFEILKKKKEEKSKEYDIVERIQEVKEEVGVANFLLQFILLTVHNSFYFRICQLDQSTLVQLIEPAF